MSNDEERSEVMGAVPMNSWCVVNAASEVVEWKTIGEGGIENQITHEFY